MDDRRMFAMLTPSLVCRYMLHLVASMLDPRSRIEPLVRTEEGAIRSDLLTRHVEFECGDLSQGIDDYAEKVLMPHANGLAALMRLADAGQIFELPLSSDSQGCRHSFDGLSMRLIVVRPDVFRVDVLFLPRPAVTKTIAKSADAALPEYRMTYENLFA